MTEGSKGSTKALKGNSLGVKAAQGQPLWLLAYCLQERVMCEQGLPGILRCPRLGALSMDVNPSLLPWNESLCLFTPEVMLY